MSKTLALLTTFLLLGFNSFADYAGPYTAKDTAPILARYRKSPPDTSRIMLALQLSDQYFYRSGRNQQELDSALLYTTIAYKLATSLGFEQGLAMVYFQQAAIFAMVMRRQEGKVATEKAIALFSKQKNFRMLGEAYFRLASYFFSISGKDIQEKIKNINYSLTAFRKAGLVVKEAAVLESLGELYYINGDNGLALSTLKESLRVYQSVKYERLTGVYDLLGALYSELGSPYEGLRYEMLALRSAQRLDGSSIYMATIYNRIGMTHYELKEYKVAIDNYLNALKIADKHSDTATIHIVTTNLAHAHLRLKEGRKALQILNNLEKKYPVNDVVSKFWINRIYVETFRFLGQNDKATKYINEIDAIDDRFPADAELSEKRYHFLADFYLQTGRYEKAAKYIGLHKAAANKREYTQMTYINLLLQSKLDSVNQDYFSALKHYQQYSALRDSLFNETKSRQIKQLEIIYETEKKEENIAQLKKESALQQNMLQQASLIQKITYISIGLLLVIISLLIYGYRLVKKNNKGMAARQEEINSKNISLGRLLTEKEWLMKEIHHRVKNNLHMIVGLLESQSEYLRGEEAKMALADSEHRIQSMSMIHTKLYQTDNLTSIEISPYIHELVQYLKDSFQNNSTVIFSLDIDRIEMNISHAIPLGLILNETIVNSLKYAFPNDRSGRIEISFKERKSNHFVLTVADNGIGLRPDFNINNINSFGLTLIQGLSEDLNGEFKIDSKSGTTVSVSFEYVSEKPYSEQYIRV